MLMLCGVNDHNITDCFVMMTKTVISPRQRLLYDIRLESRYQRYNNNLDISEMSNHRQMAVGTSLTLLIFQTDPVSRD